MNAITPPVVAFAFDNSYARLPDRFYARIQPAPVPGPKLVRLNSALARELNLDPDALASPEGIAILAGQRIPDGAEPLAMAYAGHQFGGWVPRLGDGRAVLLGEVIDRSGVRRDIQFKGSGRTPFSRMGDGKAALGPVMREYIVSEGMAAMGIPTTRALAAVTTGEVVMREQPLPGAILTRVARSHVRVGTFQYFAHRRDVEALKTLADYCIDRHDPQAREAPNPYRALLDAVIARQAKLVADWMAVGFIHGVMNTDNMAISGETIDYGPCAFMEAYHPATVFSSIDHMGRYAFGNQPPIAHWNLMKFAQCLLPLLADEVEAAQAQAQESLDGFPDLFNAAAVAGLRRKLGLAEARDDDWSVIQGLLTAMVDGEADYTLTFRRLSDLPGPEAWAGPADDDRVASLFTNPKAFDAWAEAWRARLRAEGRDDAARQADMRAANPAYIPRNHLVEGAIAAATEAEDYTPFEALLAAISDPFTERPGLERFMQPAAPNERVYQTFCGT